MATRFDFESAAAGADPILMERLRARIARRPGRWRRRMRKQRERREAFVTGDRLAA